MYIYTETKHYIYFFFKLLHLSQHIRNYHLHRRRELKLRLKTEDWDTERVDFQATANPLGDRPNEGNSATREPLEIMRLLATR